MATAEVFLSLIIIEFNLNIFILFCFLKEEIDYIVVSVTVLCIELVLDTENDSESFRNLVRLRKLMRSRDWRNK